MAPRLTATAVFLIMAALIAWLSCGSAGAQGGEKIEWLFFVADG
jgi:hypothetical protein